MHLTILSGGMVVAGLGSMLLFSGLKTLADYLSQFVEHRILEKKK
jgi:hypothetical protein